MISFEELVGINIAVCQSAGEVKGQLKDVEEIASILYDFEG